SSYRDVVKVVLPAVVNVQAEPKTTPRQNREATPKRRAPMEGSPEELFRRFFEGEGPDFEFQTPEDFQRRESFGSGFIIDPKGVIVTNYHVVSGAGKVRIELKDGTQYTSTDIKGDQKNDLAIIRIHPNSSLPYLE